MGSKQDTVRFTLVSLVRAYVQPDTIAEAAGGDRQGERTCGQGRVSNTLCPFRTPDSVSLQGDIPSFEGKKLKRRKIF